MPIVALEHQAGGGGSVVYEEPLSRRDPSRSWWVRVILTTDGHGSLVVSDLGVYLPHDVRQFHGIPQGGVTSRLLRSVRLGEIVERARQALAEDAERFASFAAVTSLVDPDSGEVLSRGPRISFGDMPRALSKAPAVKPGRRRQHRDQFLALLAVRYGEKIASGSRRPNAELAQEFDLKPEQIRDLIHEARRYKAGPLLTDAPRGGAGRPQKSPGRPGGQPTPLAYELLRDPEEGGDIP